MTILDYVPEFQLLIGQGGNHVGDIGRFAFHADHLDFHNAEDIQSSSVEIKGIWLLARGRQETDPGMDREIHSICILDLLPEELRAVDDCGVTPIDACGIVGFGACGEDATHEQGEINGVLELSSRGDIEVAGVCFQILLRFRPMGGIGASVVDVILRDW